MSETKPNNGGDAIAPATVTKPGQMVRQEFGASELTVSAETTTAFGAALAKAMVEARFVMAMRRPRDWDDVRERLLKAIERPGFAGRANEETRPGQAWYRKPIGKGVEGFSIRFAEEALRCMGNIDVRPTVVWEDREKRLIDVMVLDLENNIAFTQTVVVPKTVERSSLDPGETALRQRVNSKGKPVFTREATEDETVSGQNSAISKIMRNEILRILPGDIQAACRERIREIRLGDAATDPEGVKREVTAAFAKLNVMPSGLKQYLGHELETATPAELAELRELYKEIKEAKVTWHDALHAALKDRGDEPPAEPPGEKKTGLDAVKDALKGQAAETKLASAPEQPKACEHVTIPQQRIDALKTGQTIACADCGQKFSGPPREPGSDDVEEPPDPAAAPDSAIASGAPPSAADKKAEPAKKNTQRKLSEA